MDERATTAAELFAHLAHRGYSVNDFARALADLTEQGWIRQNGEKETYQVTEAGRTIRAAVEQLTDAYFYRPWAILNQAELDELLARVAKLHDSL